MEVYVEERVPDAFEFVLFIQPVGTRKKGIDRYKTVTSSTSLNTYLASLQFRRDHCGGRPASSIVCPGIHS